MVQLLQRLSSVHLNTRTGTKQHFCFECVFTLAGKRLFGAEMDGGELYCAAGAFQKLFVDVFRREAGFSLREASV